MVPVEQKGKRGPATCCSNNLRWYTSKEKFDGTSYAETMPKDMCEHGGQPDMVAKIKEFMFEENLRLRKSSCVCKEGG